MKDLRFFNVFDNTSTPSPTHSDLKPKPNYEESSRILKDIHSKLRIFAHLYIVNLSTKNYNNIVGFKHCKRIRREMFSSDKAVLLHSIYQQFNTSNYIILHSSQWKFQHSTNTIEQTIDLLASNKQILIQVNCNLRHKTELNAHKVQCF